MTKRNRYNFSKIKLSMFKLYNPLISVDQSISGNMGDLKVYNLKHRMNPRYYTLQYYKPRRLLYRSTPIYSRALSSFVGNRNNPNWTCDWTLHKLVMCRYIDYTNRNFRCNVRRFEERKKEIRKRKQIYGKCEI